MSETCAAYARVSSDLQDYERQIEDIKRFASSNSLLLQDENLFTDKLSGFKNEREREGLNELLEKIIEKGIKKVIVWEISRLSRKHKTLLELRDFFQKNKINVRFLREEFWLLDEKHEISAQAGLSIALFGWLFQLP